MSQRESKAPLQVAADQIGATEERLQTRLKIMKKVLSCLTSGRKKLAAQKQPLKELKKLTDSLDVLCREAADTDLDRLKTELTGYLQAASGQLDSSFRDAIDRESRKVSLPCGSVAGTFFVGPFALTVDIRREASSLVYAKVPVIDTLPIDAEKVVAEASHLKDALLTHPTNISALSADFEEAIKIKLVRAKKPVTSRELRAELPGVYHELVLLRQDRAKPLTKSNFREYPIPQFVVDLKTLVQSDFNSEHGRFRLESAVIENTRDTKKSVFIPQDLSRGYGEGTYFQAIILTSSG